MSLLTLEWYFVTIEPHKESFRSSSFGHKKITFMFIEIEKRFCRFQKSGSGPLVRVQQRFSFGFHKTS